MSNVCACRPRAKAVCGDANCIRSFAAHPRARYWSAKNAYESRDVMINSREQITFDCGHGHSFTLELHKVVQSRQWCWYCINKTEIKLLDWLSDNNCNKTTAAVVTQYRQDWCRNPETGRHLPFDVAIPSLRVIIELDGRQHYLVKQGWPSPVGMQMRDAYKMKAAIDRGWTVIRVLQESVWWDRDDWEVRLKLHLREHAAPRCIFLDSDDKCEYNGLREIADKLDIPGSNN